MRKEESVNNSFERISQSSISECSNIKNRKNSFFIFTLLLLGIATLFVAVVVSGSTNELVRFEEVFSGCNWNYIYLIIAIVFVCFLTKSFGDYLLLYSKTRQRKFFSILMTNVETQFYGGVSFYSRGERPIYISNLINNDIDDNMAIDMYYTKSLLNKISRLLYWFVVLVLGVIFCFYTVDLFLIMASFAIFIISCIIVLNLIFSSNNIQKYILFISKLSKNLYKWGFVKDYEKFFKRLVDNFIMYSRVFKNKKYVIIYQLISNIIVMFLSHFVLFVLFQMINFGNGVFIEMIFKLSIINILTSIWPLPKGLICFEFLFIYLMKGIFFSGYVVWGLILYRLITYYLVIIPHLIIVLIGKIRVGKKDRT